MVYRGGQEARIGDVVVIASKHRGLVVACLARSEYSSSFPEVDWSYLGGGILVDTDYGGLVHFPESTEGQVSLEFRADEL